MNYTYKQCTWNHKKKHAYIKLVSIHNIQCPGDSYSSELISLMATEWFPVFLCGAAWMNQSVAEQAPVANQHVMERMWGKSSI